MSLPFRKLVPGEEGAARAFLRPRVDASRSLLGNLRAAGLADTGATYGGTWVAAFDGDAIAGLAAHCWNGVLLLQAPRELPALARVPGPVDCTIA